MRQAVFIGLMVVVGMAVLLRLILWGIPGITITSWYRTPKKNRAVGGAKRSAHLLAWAADIVPVSGVLENKLRGLFPFVLNEGDHLHVGWY